MGRNKIIPDTPSQEVYAAEEDQGEVFAQDDPFELFHEWFVLAKASEPNDANAFTLATVDGTGMPDARIVLMKDLDDKGLSFFTNAQSAKGRQLASQPWAGAVFHWKSIRRQVRFRGEVQEVSARDADEYFAARARGSQIGAWASNQSAEIASPDGLARRVEEFEDTYAGKTVPRPPHWTGYRLRPTEIEFWVNRPFRLHDRLRFDLSDGAWSQRRLFP